MKKIMLLMTVCVWWHKATAQTKAGLEQYYAVHKNAVSFMPILWCENNAGWYAEGRYNYEAANTFSLYGGKTFKKESVISSSLTGLLGAVAGEFNGGAVAANAEIEYKKFTLSFQSQYSFSVENKMDNFIYLWSDISFQTTYWLSAGLSLQQTKLYQTKVETEKGIFATARFGKWEFPIYIFNPDKNERYVLLGINFSWEHKKKSVPQPAPIKKM
jgi:hypothetical protein